MKKPERNLVFKEVSGSAKGIVGNRQKLAEDETGKANCTYAEKHLVCPRGESAY